MSTWRPQVPQRDITVYFGEDIDIGGHLTRNGADWTPDAGTELFFRVFRDAADGDTLDLQCTLTGAEFKIHVEVDVAATFTDQAAFWFYIKTPDTTDGNPKVITTGVVNRVDPGLG